MKAQNTNNFFLRQLPIFIALLTIPVSLTFAQNTPENADQCMIALLGSGDDELTLGQIRAQCTEVQPATVVVEAKSKPEGVHGPIQIGRAQQRLRADRDAAARPFSILAHKPNYILAGAHNFEEWAPENYQLTENDPAYTNKSNEAQFQISLKVPFALDLFNGHMDIYGAYTNRSFWQLFNEAYSEPFRETNHEPEFWVQFANDWDIWGFTNVLNTTGFVHQSNGQSDVQSRSWNRMYASFIFEKDDFVVSFKPWVWLTADKDGSDNPDITDYMGHGEILVAWQRKGHVVNLMLRNQLESGFDKGAVELGWSIPVFNYPYLKTYVQYFHGYGESLIDYNRKVSRIGIGISVTDWID